MLIGAYGAQLLLFPQADDRFFAPYALLSLLHVSGCLSDPTGRRWGGDPGGSRHPEAARVQA